MKTLFWLLLLCAAGLGVVLWYFLNVPTSVPQNPVDGSVPFATSAPPKPADWRLLPKDMSSEPASDPRLTVKTIFRNVRPEVAYVGDSNCAECHQGLCDSFHQHPMGRSAIIAGADQLEGVYGDVMDPIHVGPYELSVKKDLDGLVQVIRAKGGDGKYLPEVEYPISIAIGSGTRGRSYASLDEDSVWQAPMSWFTEKGCWDVSPGFNLGEATQRPIVHGCLYCHVNQSGWIEDSVNRYKLPVSKLQLSIGCERCHGPGELHAKEHATGIVEGSSKDGIDTTIVNPKHLSDELQMSICAQCHLGGKTRVVRKDRTLEEFRPGLPLDLFVNGYISTPDSNLQNKAVGHFDQLLLAQCRTSSGKALLCSSCHDPHRKHESEEEERLQLQNCKSCHQDRGCSATAEVRSARQDNCIKCHMPTTDDTQIAHTSLTDHRILRDPSKPLQDALMLAGQTVLIPYFNCVEVSEAEKERDLGIALARFAEKIPADSPRKQQTLDQAKSRLKKSLEKWPDDTQAWIAFSAVEAASGNLESAMSVMQAAAKIAPKDEAVLSQAANIAELAGQVDAAIALMNDLVAINPASHDYRIRRMMMYMSSGDFFRTEAESRELLRINPLQPMARLVLGLCLYGEGQKDAAQAEVNHALQLATSKQQQASIQSWFQRFVAWRSQAR
jgi:Tfp pilus assembly protein PilF